MEVNFIPASETPCTSSSDSVHAARLHLPYSSLPKPAEPLSISNLPIEVQSKIPNGSLKTIANLWLQLLSIQIQNGNFWKYEDLQRVYERSHPKSRKATGGVAPRKQHVGSEITQATASTASSEPTDSKFGEKHVFYLRHKLQKGFLSRDRPTTEDEIPELSGYLKKLEENPSISARILKLTKIHKVLIALLKLAEIPGEEEFDFRPRCERLLETYRANLAAPVEEDPVTTPASIEMEQEKDTRSVNMDTMPEICLSLMTPEECQKYREAAKAQDPPLDDAVIDLMCILPYITFQGDRDHYEVAGIAKLPSDPTKIDREVYCGGPLVPQQMAQLTWASYYTWEGGSTYVDTKTGDGIELINYEPGDGEGVCTTFESKNGKHPHIEVLLRLWIDKYLTGKWVATGGERIITDEHRWIEYLDYKDILLEFGWPRAFPLPVSTFNTFLQRMHDHHQEKENQGFRDGWRMPDKWHELQRSWIGPITHNYSNDATREEKNARERDGLLNQKIGETLRRYEDRKQDREYAIRADVPFNERFRQPVSLQSSANIADDWRVDIEPEELLARFKDVVAANPKAVQDEDVVKDMVAVMEKAYVRGQNERNEIWQPESASEADDDSTSDFDLEEDGSEDDDAVEEWETDEEDDDLDFDVVMLEADMQRDLDTVMSGIEGYHIS